MAKPNLERALTDEERKLYEPSAEVLARMQPLKCWGICAPWGSGKDTLMDELANGYPDLFGRVIGDTTRPMREGESQGQPYFFRTAEEFKYDVLSQRFAQLSPEPINGHDYATRPSGYPADKIGLMAVQARAMETFRRLNFRDYKWVQIVPPDFATWQAWQSGRQPRGKDLADRWQEAIESINQALLNQNRHDTYFIYNDEIPKAVERALQIQRGKRPSDEPKAKKAATNILEMLKKEQK